MDQKSWKLHMKIMIWTIIEKLASSLFSRHSTTRKKWQSSLLGVREWETNQSTHREHNFSAQSWIQWSMFHVCKLVWRERERTNNSGMFNRISFLDWLDNAYLHLVGILQWRRGKPVFTQVWEDFRVGWVFGEEGEERESILWEGSGASCNHPWVMWLSIKDNCSRHKFCMNPFERGNWF